MSQTIGGTLLVAFVLLAAGRSGPGLLLIAAAVTLMVLVAKAKALTRTRTSVGHAHGAGPALLRHEGGHLHAASKIGARVTSAHVGSSSGLVSLNRGDVDRMSSRQYIAFMRVGRHAGGTGSGCSGDDRNIREEKVRMRKAGMAAAEIRKVQRQADGDARSWARSERVDHWAAELGKRGRL